MHALLTKSTGFIVLLGLLLAMLVVNPGSAFAANSNPDYCDSDVAPLTNLDIQNDVPVIFVHGFNGHSEDWGDPTRNTDFAGVVNQIPGVTVAHLFSYNSFVWVDNPGSGPKLAKTIDCVARLSLQNGGKGKVIVVGLSMGGLVARDALNRRSSDGQRAIRDEVGQVITIGTPHTGTDMASGVSVLFGALLQAFLPRLPRFPSQTTVHTIAGDVVRVFYDKNGNEVKREQPHNDTLVPTASANVAHTSDVNKGGGETTIICEKRYRAQGFLGRYKADKEAASCEHASLISNASNDVREDTVNAIQRYVASLSSVSLTVGSLTTKYDSRWTYVYYGASGLSRDGIATDTTNSVPCPNCTETPVPTSYAHVFLDAYDWYCTNPVETCAVRHPLAVRVGAAPPVTIGGRTPDYSARYIENYVGYGYETFAWCFSDQKLCVDYDRVVYAGEGNTPQLVPSQALLDVFSTATWSN